MDLYQRAALQCELATMEAIAAKAEFTTIGFYNEELLIFSQVFGWVTL